MQRGIGRGEFEEAEERRDTEFTLGPAMLLAIGLGLMLLCGLFFGLGYAAGRRSPASGCCNKRAAHSGATHDRTNRQFVVQATGSGDDSHGAAATGGCRCATVSFSRAEVRLEIR